MARNTAPTLVSYTETSWITSGTRTTGSISWNTGDVIVVVHGQEGGGTLGTPTTTGTGLSFTVQKSNTTSSTCVTKLSTAVASATSSGTISATNSSNFSGLAVYVFRGSDGVGVSAEQHTGTHTVSVTPTDTHSAFVWAAFDFTVEAVGSLTPTPTTTRQAASSAGHYVYYVGELQDKTAATAASFGVTGGGTSGIDSILVMEVLGTTTASGVTVTPGVATLATTTFAPTVTASNNQSVTPGVRTLTITTLTPSVITGNIVTPGLAPLAISVFAPSVSVSNNQLVTPGLATLNLAAFAPVVTASNNQTVTPSVASLTISTFAPSVSVGSNLTVTPSTASLTTSSFAPTISVSDNKTVTPGVLALVSSLFAPAVTATDNKTATPGVLALVMSAFPPTVSTGGSIVVTPGKASLALTTFAPVGGATGVTAYPANIYDIDGNRYKRVTQTKYMRL